MWQLTGDRTGITQSDSIELHRERTGIRIVAGTGQEDGDHRTYRFGHRIWRHGDIHI